MKNQAKMTKVQSNGVAIVNAKCNCEVCTCDPCNCGSSCGCGNSCKCGESCNC